MQKLLKNWRKFKKSILLEGDNPEIPLEPFPAGHVPTPEEYVRRELNNINKMYPAGETWDTLFDNFNERTNAIEALRNDPSEEIRAAFQKIENETSIKFDKVTLRQTGQAGPPIVKSEKEAWQQVKSKLDKLETEIAGDLDQSALEKLRTARKELDAATETFQMAMEYTDGLMDKVSANLEDIVRDDALRAGRDPSAAVEAHRTPPSAARATRYRAKVAAEKVAAVAREKAAKKAAEKAAKAYAEAWTRPAWHAGRRGAIRGFGKILTAGLLGLGLDWLSAYGTDTELHPHGVQSFEDWMEEEEEFITGIVPGAVSPSQFKYKPLSKDDEKRIEATQGVVGVSDTPLGDRTTYAEVEAYIKNRLAKGIKLPDWAERITKRLPNGQISIKPREHGYRERTRPAGKLPAMMATDPRLRENKKSIHKINILIG